MGAFAGLPLHAAAPSDEFVQSYTSSLGTLLSAGLKTQSTSQPAVGIVGVTHTGSGESSTLPGVSHEVEIINTIIKGQTQVVSSLLGEQATVDAVKLSLQQCEWLHLACHGKQDLDDPPSSHLQLYDGILDLQTILKLPLPKAEFVFLAACQTAMGDMELVNESFHLCGGFLAAGFQGAIGTMWAMLDLDGPVVAREVYTYMFANNQRPQVRHAAKALQLAVRAMRNAGVPYQRWIPFIHMGI